MTTGNDTFKSALSVQVSAALVTFLVAVITVPTDWVVGRFKFAINRADERQATYTALAKEVSTYVFEAHIFQEFFEQNITNRTTVGSSVESYNAAITALRSDQYATRAALGRYWSSADALSFDDFMQTAGEVDRAAHALNPALNAYLADENAALNNAETSKAAIAMKPSVEKLCTAADALLLRLAGVKELPPKRGCPWLAEAPGR